MASVLIVDDDPVICDVLHELFSAEYLTHTVESAERALTLLEAGNYDVAIVDISLPGMSGIELLGHIRQRWPRLPVIIITGIDYHQYVADLIRMGAADYLVKPFQLQDAEATVARAILRQEGWLDAVKESTERALKASRALGEERSAQIERRCASRHAVQRAARLLFTTPPSDRSSAGSAQYTPALIGHTRDINATGLSLIVPGVHSSDSEFFGTEGPLRIILSLPTAMIDVELTPVRYEWLDEHAGKKSYLIGARITAMSDDDRKWLDEYLGTL